jgi:hypothetical protein
VHRNQQQQQIPVAIQIQRRYHLGNSPDRRFLPAHNIVYKVYFEKLQVTCFTISYYSPPWQGGSLASAESFSQWLPWRSRPQILFWLAPSESGLETFKKTQAGPSINYTFQDEDGGQGQDILRGLATECNRIYSARWLLKLLGLTLLQRHSEGVHGQGLRGGCSTCCSQEQLYL